MNKEINKEINKKMKQATLGILFLSCLSYLFGLYTPIILNVDRSISSYILLSIFLLKVIIYPFLLGWGIKTDIKVLMRKTK